MAQQERYRAALKQLTAQLREDRYVLAAMVSGSLSYDEVWERSDIDLMVVTTEDLKKPKCLTLVVDGISVHVTLHSRSQFKAQLGSAIQSSFLHSYFAKSSLLFSRDESLTDLYRDAQQVGARDREIQLLRLVGGVVHPLTKAEKWLRVKRDWHYAFFWLMKGMDDLAAVEVLSHGEITTREVIAQALRRNPAFFGRVYTGLIDGPKTEAAIAAAIEDVRGYLKSRPRLFAPIMEYLAEAGSARSATEIDHHFQTNFGLRGADMICEWLADEGLLHKVSTPVRLVEKSRVSFEEAAYLTA